MDWGVVLGIIGGPLAIWVLLIVVLGLARPRGVRLAAAVRVVPDVLRLARDLVADRSAPIGVRLALVGLAVARQPHPADPGVPAGHRSAR